MLDSFGAGLGAGVFAEKVLFLSGRQPRMAVRCRYQTELVRIDTNPLFDLQPNLQRAARILVLQHVVFLQRAQVKIALIPGFVVGEFVIGREERMGFAIAFDLGSLVEGFPSGPGLSVRSVDAPSKVRPCRREHGAV